MSIFFPTVRVRNITDISNKLLDNMGITTLVLDVDNTLTTHNNPIPKKEVLDWLYQTGIVGGKRLVILSNNHEERVRDFSQKLGLEYTANACKPLTKGFSETAKRLNVTKGEMAMVGDQIFTDILGANLFGAKSFLVDPMELEGSWGFKIKRVVEKSILKKIDYTNLSLL